MCSKIGKKVQKIRQNHISLKTKNKQKYEKVQLKGGLLAKFRKLFFSGEVIFGGQNPKNAKKISKYFIVPNRSLGYTDHLYTYNGHIEHVGFT